MDVNQLLELIQQAGMFWVVMLAGGFILLVFAFPIGSIFTLVLAKRLLLKDASDWMKQWLNKYQEDHHKGIEHQVKTAERLDELGEHYKSIVDGLFSHRSYQNDQMTTFSRKLDKVIELQQKIIIYLARKQKGSEPVKHRPTGTEVFLTEDRPS